MSEIDEEISLSGVMLEKMGTKIEYIFIACSESREELLRFIGTLDSPLSTNSMVINGNSSCSRRLPDN